MRKGILLFFVVFWLSVVMSWGLSAQSFVGFAGGYQQTNYFDKSENGPHYSGKYHSPSTYCFNIFLKQIKTKGLHLGYDLAWVKKSLDLQAEYGGQGGQIDRDLHFNLHYLYLSIFPEKTFKGLVSFHISAGPSLGYLVYSHKNGSGQSWIGGTQPQQHNWVEDGNAQKDFVEIDFRIFLKLSLEIPLKSNVKIILENSYSRGLMNTAYGNLGDNAGFINSNDMTLTLGLGYTLNNFKFPYILPKPKDHQKDANPNP